MADTVRCLHLIRAFNQSVLRADRKTLSNRRQVAVRPSRGTSTSKWFSTAISERPPMIVPVHRLLSPGLDVRPTTTNGG